MDDKQTETIVGYAILAIIAYYVLQLVLPFLFAGIIGIVVVRLYQKFK